ncbi:MAG: Uma2 family endonuclease [Chloroflexota bacterium]|nr:Uma2 family endonuclease [Chloroflexota bacterium]
MATVSQRRTWTYADLADWPESVGEFVEIIDGELIVTPAPIPPHELLTMELVFAFGAVVRPNRLGRLFTAPVDVLLPDGGVLQPDLVFVRTDRLGIVGRTAIEGPPDIVVEILSPSTRARDLGRKKELYAALGVPEYWLVDPDLRAVDLFALRGGAFDPLPQEDGTVRSRVLPDLAIDVAALFAAARL